MEGKKEGFNGYVSKHYLDDDSKPIAATSWATCFKIH